MKISLFFILTCFAFSACQKPDPIDECIKQRDDCLYFRCKVNGQEWRKNCKGAGIWGCRSHDFMYNKTTGYLSGKIINDSEKETIFFVFDSIHIGVNYNPRILNFADDKYDTFDCRAFLTILKSELIIDKIDTQNVLISGTFHFILMNNCGDTVEIDDVEFQLDYR